MLFPDREGAVDRELGLAAQGAPLTDVTDEDGARHRLWHVTDPASVANILLLMAPMKLLIADGLHRYETALNFRDEHPDNPAAQYAMMTFVNMFSPGLKILATHRVFRHLTGFSIEGLLAKATGAWSATLFDSLKELKQAFTSPPPQSVRIGVVTASKSPLLHPPHE